MAMMSDVTKGFDDRIQCLEQIILTLADNAVIPPGKTRDRVRELRTRLEERSG